MSFAGEVREELIKHFDRSQVCRRAELAAVMLLSSRNISYDRQSGIYVYTDPKSADFTTLRKTYNIGGELNTGTSLKELTKTAESRKAFLRGAFIAQGTISSPKKEYHYEITAPGPQEAEFIISLMSYFEVNGRINDRRGKSVVYVKDGDEISLMLGITGAVRALLEFENARIEHEINGSVNRRINCDNANINRQIEASMKQIEDIELLQESTEYEKLNDSLKAVCEARLLYPDATLAELGEIVTPPVGKSGINHRLRKISSLAASIRKKSGQEEL